MLMINNDVVKQVLTMRECIAAQENAFAGLKTQPSALKSSRRPATPFWRIRNTRVLRPGRVGRTRLRR